MGKYMDKGFSRTVQPDIEAAIEMYYSRIELNNQDINKIFGGKRSTATIRKLKAHALARQIEEKCDFFDKRCVNTRCAYAAWGLNIEDLKERHKNLKQIFPEKYKDMR